MIPELKSRKGAFFSLDALVAVTIMLVAFSLVAGMSPPNMSRTVEYQKMHYLAEDAVQAFSNTPFSSINETIRNEIVADPRTNITNASGDMDKSLIDIVGMLWSINQTGYAANITRDFFGKLLPGMNYSLMIGDYKSTAPAQIYSSTGMAPGPEPRKSQTSVFRIISGYRENSPYTGFVSRAYVAGITKKTQSYVYFGGFEGNGNITKILALPSVIGTINEAYIEMDSPSNFTLYINGAYAGQYNVSARLLLRSKNWTVPSAYYPNFSPGSNNITLSFPDINSAYVGGGFIRVSYNTTSMDTSDITLNPDGNVTDRYYFPGIDGLINIYSSLYVPGALRSMGIQLHYLSNYTVYLIIGNASVYENSTNVTKTVYLNNSFLGSILNYSAFNQTMPIRFGTKNVSGLSEGSDVVLTTDLSGSMSTCDVNASTPPDCNGASPGIQNARIDVAKASDSQFVNVILGNPGQNVGLIAYDTTTISSKTVNLTSDNATLINMINTYSAGSCTCISCGIQSSTDMLASMLNVTPLIASKSQWYYNDSFLSGVPPPDSGLNWTQVNYGLSLQWSGGNAVFGNGTYSIPVATNISGSAKSYLDLGNITRGAKYDYDNTTIVYGALGGARLNFSTMSGSPLQNRCSGYDCSGGYVIRINITPQQYAMLSSGGAAYISFGYAWNTTTASAFSSFDEAWIKSRWTSPFSGAHYLGSELSSAGGDTTLEVANEDYPRYNFSGYFVQNITGWVEGPGIYYFDFGGKLYANSRNAGGNFSFDALSAEIANTTDTVYFRKNFTIPDISSVGKGILKVMSDDAADVYINGMMVLNDSASAHNANYWNSISTINRKYFNQGQNIVAVKLYNKANPSRFDLALNAINDSRNKAMVVMTDGEANTLIGGGGCAASVTVASNDAINRSCAAYENYGIISNSVGFGADAVGSTLQAIADCGHGNYYSSNDADQLKKIYQDIANSIISFSTQAAEISGGTAISKLYTDSFIEYNYTPAVDLSYGNISLTLESNTFGNTSGNYSVESPKNGSYYISPNMVVLDAKATSYSSDFWTSILETNSTTGSWRTAYNLNSFGNNYLSLGDPYIVNIPVSFIKPGEMNYVRVNTAKNSTELEGGSPDDSVIYSIKIKGTVDYGSAFPTKEQADADAINRLSSYLASLGISATGINTGSQDIGKIPWMWGPAIMTLEVWK